MTTVKLKTPIKHGDKTVDGIEVGEPSVGGVGAYQKAEPDGEYQATIAMLSVETGIPVPALSKMKMSDFKTVMESLTPFIKALGDDTGPTGDSSAQT